MAVEEALYAKLEGTAAVSALVGTRIYPLRMPDKVTLPAIRYQRVDTQRPLVMGVATGLADILMQVDCWGATATTMFTLRDEIRQALERWRQSGPPVIQDTFIVGEQDMGFELDAQAYRGTVDVRIWAEE